MGTSVVGVGVKKFFLFTDVSADLPNLSLSGSRGKKEGKGTGRRRGGGSEVNMVSMSRVLNFTGGEDVSRIW